MVAAGSIAEKLGKKDQRNFWQDVKCTTNNNVKRAINVEGVHKNINSIASAWQHCYANSIIFNSIIYFTRGFMPQSLTESVIGSPQNRNKRANDQCNYRPIGLYMHIQ